MRTIELELKKNNKVVKTLHFIGPSSWKDITQEHLRIWANVMSSPLEAQMAKSILAARLFKIPKQIFIKVLDKKERFRLSLAIAFLFEKNGLSDWHLPFIKSRFRKYYGPKSRLSNLTAEEFTLCELCYEKFDITKDLECLDLLAAILYRPRRWFGINDDIRQAITINGIEKRAKRFKRLPKELKTAIYLNYEGSRNYIFDQNKAVFKKGAGTGKPSITPWSKIIRSGAGGIFGTLSETEKTNIHKFLAELNTRIKEDQDKQQ